MAMGKSAKPICERTGLTRPECCCPDCITEQIRTHQPHLLEADPTGEIRVTSNLHPRRRPRRAA